MVDVFCSVERAWFSSQLDGLGNGCECIRDARNFDRSASSVRSCPDPCSEGCEDDVSFDVWDVSEEGIDVAQGGVFFPVCPVFDAIPGSLSNDAMGNSSPRRHNITRDARSFGIWNSVQDLFCGRGKWRLKYCVRLLFAAEYWPFLNLYEVLLNH